MATRANSAGFSLLELLLTLVVIGLIISMAGLSVSSGRRPYQIDSAARSFVDVAEYAMDEAQLSGTDMGLLLQQRLDRDATIFSYEWLQRSGDVWRVAPFDEDAYGRRDLPLDVEVFLEIEEDDTKVQDREDAADEDLPPLPQIVFYSSGETTPGLMTWIEAASGEILWELEWDLLGRFSLRRRGEVDEDAEE
ncbi:MAG: GspH/FimT family pseudopilin [Halieaceae bacterium]